MQRACSTEELILFPMLGDTHRHTQTHTDAGGDAYTPRNPDTQTHTQTHTYTDAGGEAYTHAQTHRHTDTQTHTRPLVPAKAV